ncbi:MAG: hypothetical protein P8J33_03580, partial [Pirellulaceae bacterium]|nr:hypothetical protein [Pirellulaceae bacterium]
MANRPLYGILVCILLHSICSPIASQAQPAGEQPIQSMVVENELRSQYLGARLDLQRHFLKQLQDLQANGHAAWLEVRRQQLVVDQIAAQISALDQYKIFILDVAKTVTKEVLSSKRTLADPAPLMIYSNDSIRLIGWVEPDSSGLGSLATASRGPLDRFAIELPSNEPQHKQEQTQRRYQRELEEVHLPP